jgi:hypothetical protein
MLWCDVRAIEEGQGFKRRTNYYGIIALTKKHVREEVQTKFKTSK